MIEKFIYENNELNVIKKMMIYGSMLRLLVIY